jgi:hypothetical protein
MAPRDKALTFSYSNKAAIRRGDMGVFRMAAQQAKTIELDARKQAMNE